MDREIRELIDILLRSVAQDEGFARDLAELAYQLGEEGRATAARGMLDLSRRHQIKGMEGRARIFALADRYGQSYDHPPSSTPSL